MPTNPLRWLYDYRSMRYRDLATGRFVSSKQVRDWAQQALDASSDRAASLGGMVANSQLSVTDWERAMRLEIKNEYIAQYLAGRGGVHRMTQADYGSIGGMIADQYRYLSNFAREIANGNLTEGQIVARARMYLNSSREAYERAHWRSAQDAGMEYVFWHTFSLAEHCDDCVAFEGMGWQPVSADPYHGAFPGSGDTVCLTNCKCWFDFGSAQMAAG